MRAKIPLRDWLGWGKTFSILKNVSNQSTISHITKISSIWSGFRVLKIRDMKKDDLLPPHSWKNYGINGYVWRTKREWCSPGNLWRCMEKIYWRNQNMYSLPWLGRIFRRTSRLACRPARFVCCTRRLLWKMGSFYDLRKESRKKWLIYWITTLGEKIGQQFLLLSADVTHSNWCVS